MHFGEHQGITCFLVLVPPNPFNTNAVLIGSKRLMNVHASFQCISGVFVFAVADLVNLLGKIQSS